LTQTKAEAPARRQPVIAEDRRRSQRVMLKVAVTLHLSINDKPTTLDAHTLVVNTHGAMLCVQQNLAADTHLELEHNRSQERRRARVTRKPQSSPDGWLVPVEFEEESRDFWHVSFPPANWKPLMD
jgi:hypothetical protein